MIKLILHKSDQQPHSSVCPQLSYPVTRVMHEDLTVNPSSFLILLLLVPLKSSISPVNSWKDVLKDWAILVEHETNELSRLDNCADPFCERTLSRG